MIRTMIFIDGSWLYRLHRAMQKEFIDSTYRVDYGKFPPFVRRQLAIQLPGNESEVDIVRPYLFGSIPTDVRAEDEEIVERRLSFYGDLRERYGFETRIHTKSFKNHDDPARPHRVKNKDRIAEGDYWCPREKCVDVDLGSTMVYDAAINAFDVADKKRGRP